MCGSLKSTAFTILKNLSQGVMVWLFQHLIENYLKNKTLTQNSIPLVRHPCPVCVCWGCVHVLVFAPVCALSESRTGRHLSSFDLYLVSLSQSLSLSWELILLLVSASQSWGYRCAQPCHSHLGASESDSSPCVSAELCQQHLRGFFVNTYHSFQIPQHVCHQ